MPMATALQNRPKRGGGPRGARRRPEALRRRVPKMKLRARERAAIALLEERILVEMPAPGQQWIPPAAEALASEASFIETAGDSKQAVKGCHLEHRQSSVSAPLPNSPTVSRLGKSILTQLLFEDLPLSEPTLKGLSLNRFRRLTAVQAAAIPHALAGRDVRAQARTGSGKTLAFVVPILERLFRGQISNVDGLAALAIAPTRELAVQIFDVFREVGRHHEFSLGCLMGGKDLRAEAERVQSLNIVVGTPGRLLQHIDESPMWDSSHLLILAVDEADRLVDMGFFDSLRLIVESLPSSRQTLLFSATLKSAVSRLGVFLCKGEAETVGLGEGGGGHDESALKQSFLVVQQKHKTSALFSILRAQCRKKVVVFVSSCKQAKFLCDAFKVLKPGMSLLYLHGRQKQQKRLATFQEFVSRDSPCCLFSTDLAARGVDFICEQKPKKGSSETRVSAVDLVVQFDCPDSVETHIHRVGRTARLQRKGQAVLLLLPSEAEFASQLRARGISLKQISLNPKKAIRVDAKLQAILAANSELKNLAQKAVAAYLRCVAIMPDKSVFNLKAIDLQQLALCYGLQIAPSLEQFENSEQQTDPVTSWESGRRSAVAADAGERDIRLCGGAVTDSTQKRRKNRSKLERLKEQIRVKALEKKRRQEIPSAESNPSSETQAGADVVAEELGTGHSGTSGDFASSEGTSATVAKDDELLVRVVEGSALEETASEKRQRITETLLQKPAYKRERLRFRADGSAKMKGLAAASENSHLFFGEEDFSDEVAETGVSSQLHVTEPLDLVSQATEPSVPGLKKAFVESMRKKVAAVRDEDKARDQLRIHEKHTKRRRKERIARQLAEGGGLAGDKGVVTRAMQHRRLLKWNSSTVGCADPVTGLDGAESQDSDPSEEAGLKGFAVSNVVSEDPMNSPTQSKSVGNRDLCSLDKKDHGATREYVAKLEELALKAAAE